MRWLTPTQWAMAIKASIAAILAVLPFGGPAVDLGPPTPAAQHMGQTGSRAGLANAPAEPYGSLLDGWRRKKELDDDMDIFKDVEEAGEGEEGEHKRTEDPPEPEDPGIQFQF